MLGNLNPMLKFDFLFRNIEKKTKENKKKKINKIWDWKLWNPQTQPQIWTIFWYKRVYQQCRFKWLTIFVSLIHVHETYYVSCRNTE